MFSFEQPDITEKLKYLEVYIRPWFLTAYIYVEVIEVMINPLPCNACLLNRNQSTDLHTKSV